MVTKFSSHWILSNCHTWGRSSQSWTWSCNLHRRQDVQLGCEAHPHTTCKNAVYITHWSTHDLCYLTWTRNYMQSLIYCRRTVVNLDSLGNDETTYWPNGCTKERHLAFGPKSMFPEKFCSVILVGNQMERKCPWDWLFGGMEAEDTFQWNKRCWFWSKLENKTKQSHNTHNTQTHIWRQ